jgi:hypothetical protein
MVCYIITHYYLYGTILLDVTYLSNLSFHLYKFSLVLPWCSLHNLIIGTQTQGFTQCQ